jgi:hypothetical protein
MYSHTFDDLILVAIVRKLKGLLILHVHLSGWTNENCKRSRINSVALHENRHYKLAERVYTTHFPEITGIFSSWYVSSVKFVFELIRIFLSDTQSNHSLLYQSRMRIDFDEDNGYSMCFT